MISIKQISPQARDLVRIAIDREELLSYLSSLRNQDRPALDIDEPMKKSSKPLIEIALDSQTLVSISEALDKLGSHNGLYGLYTVKISFRLQIGDAPLTVNRLNFLKVIPYVLSTMLMVISFNWQPTNGTKNVSFRKLVIHSMVEKP